MRLAKVREGFRGALPAESPLKGVPARLHKDFGARAAEHGHVANWREADQQGCPAR